MNLDRIGWISALGLSVLIGAPGCGSKTPEPKSKGIPISSLVAVPSPTPNEAPPGPRYESKRQEWDAEDQLAAKDVQKVFADLNKATGDRSAALQHAAEELRPIIARLEATMKKFEDIRPPDALAGFDKASRQADGAAIDDLKKICDAMEKGDQAAFSEGLDGLAATLETSTSSVDRALSEAGYDAKAWNDERRLKQSAPTATGSH